MKTLEQDDIQVYGARVHNLQNIDIRIPRHQLVVLTGLSGSGKSSLAFDTLYAEGQRRYIETFSAYARQFLGNLERPDVDAIEGLSPVIAIEQKTTSKNPRSTVGTITEIYDFLRLMYARAGDAYSYVTGSKMVSYTDDQIIDRIVQDFQGKKISLLAPLVRARKGHYAELFVQMAKQGFLKMRVDGVVLDISPGMKVDRYKTHDIEVVIDRLLMDKAESTLNRLRESLQTALYQGDNVMMVLDHDSGQTRFFSRHLMCPDSGISYPEPEPNLFSFNSPKGACPRCKGLGQIHEINLQKIMPNPALSIKKGGLAPLGEYKNSWIFKQLDIIAQKFDFSLNDPVNKIPAEAMEIILNGGQDRFAVASKSLGVTKEYQLEFEGIVSFILQQYDDNPSAGIKRWAREFLDEVGCPDCGGSRLKTEALHFRIDNKNIFELVQMDLQSLQSWLHDLESRLSDKQLRIGREVLKEIRDRVGFLTQVGLNYLNLNRSAKTLSGGEAQRIRLATQIGSQLVGVLYILDEPSIGLHQRDNEKLIESLETLRDIGNSVLVVEHDKDMMLRADYLIDIGPKAGKGGGQIVSAGTPTEVLATDTTTARYLNGSEVLAVPAQRRTGNGHWLELKGAHGNNLQNVDLHIPLGCLVVVSGVSGSGKSTLINETLYPILNAHFYDALKKPMPYQSITGLEHLDKVIAVDQSPIGRSPRSNPATYTEVFGDIRQLFTQTPEAMIRGYKAGRFSFNVSGGRCETCEGSGLRTIEMNFLPDVYVECESCQGKRFNRETLDIRYKGKSISDVLNMTIDEAVVFFENIPKIYKKIKTIQEVGLGYITLGQPSTTLSGGEAQRIKLATELSKKDTGKTLYIMDEPTTGLHFDDVRMLMEVIEQLVQRGNTVLIIEHHMDVIKMADYLIDVGPEGGKGGGRIVAEGTPEQVVQQQQGYTYRFLQPELQS